MRSVIAQAVGCALRQPTRDRVHLIFVRSSRLKSGYDVNLACNRGKKLISLFGIGERCRRDSEQKVSRRKGTTFCTAAIVEEWKICRVAGDGRCMFRALVQGEMLSKFGEGREAFCPLCVEEEIVEKADKLRARVCDELLLRREDVEPFLESRIEDYVRRMRMERTWGGEPELAMAAHVLQRKVVVYMLKSAAAGSLLLEKISEYEPSVIQTPQDNKINNNSSSLCVDGGIGSVESLEERLLRPINLLYSGSCHYDALVLPCNRETM